MPVLVLQCFKASFPGWRGSTFAYCAGRCKGKGPGEKLPLLAVQCLQALLRLGKTAEGSADLLQDVPLTPGQEPTASDAGVHRQSLWTDRDAESEHIEPCMAAEGASASRRSAASTLQDAAHSAMLISIMILQVVVLQGQAQQQK